MNQLGNSISQASARYGDRTAYVVDAKRISFHELDGHSDRVAAALTAVGVQPGDRIAIWSRASIPFIVATMAITKLGCAVVPLNTRYRADDAVRALTLARPKMLLHGAERWESSPLFDAVGALANHEIESFVDAAIARGAVTPAEHGSHDVGDNQIAQVQFTSGSTGTPKLVQLRAAAVLRSANLWAELMGLTSSDRFFSPMPFFHAGGAVTVLFAPIVSGCCVVVQPVFDPQSALKLMHEHEVTATIGHQPHYAEYLASGIEPPESLRVALIFANRDFNIRVQEYLGRANLLSPYGLTETTTSGTAARWDDDEVIRLETVGRPQPGLDVIIDPLNPNGPDPFPMGEVLIRGWAVSPGYLADPTPILDSKGWYHTGDLGRFDDAGNLRLEGRIKDIVRVGGENVSPAEVENRLLTHPDVTQAVVMGIPNDRLGEVCVAAVSLQPDAQRVSEQDLIDFCATGLASFKVPRKIVLVSEWPTNSSGKIARTAVRALFL